MKQLHLAIATALVASSITAAPIIKDGDTLAFLGDSITQFGQNNHAGYVNLILRALDNEGIRVRPVRAGISGNKSNDMLSRLDRDVLSKKPKFMTLSCGVNDVWHADWGKGVSLADYQANITKILDKCAASNCTVIVLTATMFEKGDDFAQFKHNLGIAPYNAWLRAEAQRRGLALADLNRAMWEGHRANAKVRYTVDGVHMQPAGDRLMATEVLKAMGVAPDRFANIAYCAWETMWVLCRFDLKPTTDPAEYVALTRDVTAKVRAEPGCLEYRLLDPDGTGLAKSTTPKTLWMFEKWACRNDLKRHGSTAHMKAFAAKAAPLRVSSQVIPLQDAAELLNEMR